MPRLLEAFHWILLAIPLVEIADHGHFSCIGRPDCKVRSNNAIELDLMGAEFVVDAVVGSLVEEVNVEVCDELLFVG